MTIAERPLAPLGYPISPPRREAGAHWAPSGHGSGKLVAPTVLRVYAYIRVSSKEQAKERDKFGVPVQEAKIRAYCEARGWELAGIFFDKQSGLTLARHDLRRLRDLAEARGVDVVVAMRLDRLARVNHLRRMVEAELEAAGVEICYVEQTFERTPAGRLQRGVMGELGEYESELIRGRTMSGREQKAKAGRAPSGYAPYGYKQVTVAEARVLEKYAGRSGELEILPEWEPFIRELFERAAGGQSLRSLARWADSTPFKPKSGNVWSIATIRQLLANPVYCGRRLYGKEARRQTDKPSASGETLRKVTDPTREALRISLPCPPIVSEATWNAVRQRLADNKRLLGGRPSNAWPLSGAVECGICRGVQGKMLSATGHRAGARRYYICSSSFRDGLTFCGTRFRADALEEMARDAIRQALTPGRLAALARQEAERENLEAGNPEPRQRALEAQLKALDEEEDLLIENATKAGFSPERVKAKVGAIHAARTDAERELAEVRAAAARVRDPEEAARQADATAAKLAVGLEECLAEPVLFKQLARLLLTIRLYPSGREPDIQVIPPRPEGTHGAEAAG